MGIEEKFNQAVKDWIEHCDTPRVRDNLMPADSMDCSAYRELVAMGTAALPLIRQVFDKNSDFYFSNVAKSTLVVPSKVAQTPDFFDAMMKFQYGEAEESDAGFEEMNRIAGPNEREEVLTCIKLIGLPLLIKAILGEDFPLPEAIPEAVLACKEKGINYAKDWLDENMSRYD